MLLDLIDLAKVRKAIIYFGILLATLIVQNIILSRIEVFGTIAMILPLTAVGIGFFQGGIWGGVFGLILGIFSDISLNETAVMMTVLFPILGFASGVLTTFFVNKKLYAFCCVGIIALIITTFCQMFPFIVFSDTNKLAVLLAGGLQIILSIPFIFAVYYPCRAISGLDLSK